LLSEGFNQDISYNLDEIIDVKPSVLPNSKWHNLVHQIWMKVLRNDYAHYKYVYHKAISQLKDVDFALAIGGDNYCYDGMLPRFSAMNQLFINKRIPIGLCGCSIDDLRFNKALITDLKRYKFITARESLTYKMLKNCGFNNVSLFPDTAFKLETVVSSPLPKDKNYVGINVSSMICQREQSNGIVMANYAALLEYILHETDFDILLIPHVVNDFVPLKQLYDRYSDCERLHLVDDNNAMVLKGYISQCRFMVAARTHASIAAYSTSVPTLVVGYSIKSIGIAKDLFGTSGNYVLSIETMRSTTDLTDSFKWMLKNEDKILQIYDNNLSNYISRLNGLSINTLVNG
jgi:polysaccharide pyruvyl transferase WcaK-like protein